MNDLSAGTQYQFQVRAVNPLGFGPWSASSYTSSTQASPPHTPTQPYIDKSSMTSISFAWLAPKDSGSAITAYMVCLESTGTESLLSRKQLSWTVNFLIPGEICRIKLKARNITGWSLYSPWSCSDGRTLTRKPGIPSVLQIVDATSLSMTLEGYLPNDYGSPITSMFVQYRIMEKFSILDWEQPQIFQIPNDVSIIDNVNLEVLMKNRQTEMKNVRKGVIVNEEFKLFAAGRMVKSIPKVSIGLSLFQNELLTVKSEESIGADLDNIFFEVKNIIPLDFENNFSFFSSVNYHLTLSF